MSVTVLMARHATHEEVGHVLSGRSEIALDAAGRDQARRLGEWLSRASIDRICTSPRRRARETAATVADRCGLEAIPVAALDEIDFGEWTGRSFADLESDPRWRLWNAARDRASTPSGGTMAAATMRAVRHLEACEETGVTLCVSHGDVIRGVVAHYLGLPLDRLLSFDVDPASVSTVQLAGGAGRVVAVNERLR